MSKSGFSSMFNRLPIYTRPRGPSIGEPILVETTNERLAGQVTVVGRDARPRTTTSQSADKIDFARGLPQVHTTSLLNDFEIATDPTRNEYTTSTAPSSIHGARKKTNVIRKPVLGQLGDVITGEADRETRDSSDSNSFESSSDGFPGPSSFSSRLNLRRHKTPEQGEAPEIEIDSQNRPRRPAGLPSIDDWLDSREDLHKRTSTTTLAPKIVSQDPEPRHLKIRQSTFAPLSPEFIIEDNPPEMPLLPSRFFGSRETATATPPPQQAHPPRGASLLAMDKSAAPAPRINLPPSPPMSPDASTSSEKCEPAKPRDYIEELEHEQKQLEIQKRDYRRRIFHMEQRIEASNSISLTEQFKKQLEQLNQEYQDLEKTTHDLGLKLYRAYRRKDRAEGGEGATHLWVSRITAPVDR
ncbi:Similar to hypothetical protein [Tuber melanosporum Mel28]; acc. no. XP_002835706 [Pyronema omphalodes CBS 100304]|uniref:Uncharacterized protein n=1 Tax=Pyronema omphalodes (strain CBS 100304) TaxID=1076935 RepID=U4LLM4_PYROM|nr:Similar to hypothetical protein [Tuber melanosporum Mel28]; acc. no. XP_002835706 [Pyronema omphalodes CBS 100304]